MAEDTRPDADFSESAPEEKAESMTPVADALQESISDRFKKVSGNELRGDKIPDILRSVEKSMFLQTEFLSNISDTLKGQALFQKESAEDADRAANLASISSSGDEEKSEPKTITEKIKEGASNFKKKVSDATLGKEDDSIFKKIAKTTATAATGFFAAKGFIKTLAKKATDKLGIGEEKGEAISQSVGNSGGAGTAAAIAAKGLSFGRIGGLQAFATAAVSKLTYDALGNLDMDGDGKILGVQKELVQGTGAALAGTATFIKTGKSFGKLGSVMADKFNLAKKQVGAKGPDIKSPKGAKPTAKLPKPPKLDAPKTPKVTKLPTPTAKIPGASTITTNGKATMGRPTTVSGVANRLPADKAMKFAKFFRIAGPLAAVIPALLEPALAIYRDEPDEVVRKQTAGALGSIGGGALGAIAGGSLGTMIFPGIGSGIGAGLGGLFGAIGGEWLLEKIVGAMLDGDDLKEGDVKGEAKKNTRGPKAQAAPTDKPSEKVSAKITDVDMGPTSEQKVADAQVKADDAGKALTDFESSAKSARTVQKEDAFGDMVDTVVYDDAAEQAQFDKLSGAKFDADYAVEDATSEMITGDSFNVPGVFEKLQFLQEKGLIDGNNSIKMGKFVGGPLSGMTPDEAISMYVTQEASTQKATTEFKAGDKPIPKIEPDMTKPVTADGKIPGKVTPAPAGGFANATATGDDMGLSVEEAEKQLTDAKAAFAEAEKDETLRETLDGEMAYSQLRADVGFAEKDLADANARAAASGDFVKRKPEPVKGIMETSGIQPAPEKLMNKTKTISEDKATQDSQAKGVMMQNLTSKGGDTITNANRGGDTTNVTVLRGGGSSSLANSHLPVGQSV